MSAATSALLVYDMTTATEAPRLMLAYLQYTLLALRCSRWSAPR